MSEHRRYADEMSEHRRYADEMSEHRRYADEQKARSTDEERETTAPGNLLYRFCWQGEGEVAFLDDRGGPLTPEQWKDRLAEKHRRLAEDR